MRKRLTLAACLMGFRTALADEPAQPSYSELVEQVRALQAQVNQLQAKQTNYVSAAEVDATVRRVLADAEKRSKLIDLQGVTAGWNGEKFVLRSEDGAFSLSPILVIQERYVANYRQTVPGSTKADVWDDGFENRRLRFGLEGTFFDPRFSYRLQMSADRDNPTVDLDAYVQYRFTPDWAVKGGQFKDPWTQEENISDTRQLAVERSLLNALIGGANTGWVQGVEVTYGQAKPVRTRLVFHDGAGSRDTTFPDAPTSGEIPLLGGGNVGFGTTGRVEYFFAGDLKEYSDYSAMNNKEDLLVVGAGADFTQAGSNDGLFHSVDIQWENTHGTSAFASYVGLWRQIDNPSTGASGVNAGNFYDYGLLFQVGQMIGPKWEVFARYDWTHLDTAAFTSARAVQQGQVQEITVGVNYFIYKHNCKLTMDVNYLPDGSPAVGGLGYLATEDNEFVFRAQMTLAL